MSVNVDSVRQEPPRHHPLSRLGRRLVHRMIDDRCDLLDKFRQDPRCRPIATRILDDYRAELLSMLQRELERSFPHGLPGDPSFEDRREPRAAAIECLADGVTAGRFERGRRIAEGERAASGEPSNSVQRLSTSPAPWRPARGRAKGPTWPLVPSLAQLRNAAAGPPRGPSERASTSPAYEPGGWRRWRRELALALGAIAIVTTLVAVYAWTTIACE